MPKYAVRDEVRVDPAFYGTPLDHLLRLLSVDTLIICGTLANIGVEYTAASGAARPVMLARGRVEVVAIR